MELDQLHLLGSAAEELGQFQRQVRLARAGRPEQDELMLVREQVAHFAQPVGAVDVQLAGKLVRRFGKLQFTPNGDRRDLHARIALHHLRFIGQFLVGEPQAVDDGLNGGQLHHVVLDGKFLMELFRQLVVRVPVLRLELLHLTRDFSDVQQAFGDRAHGVARFHPGQERVQPAGRGPSP